MLVFNFKNSPKKKRTKWMRSVNLNIQKSRIAVRVNIQQVHGNSKWKYPNNISYFTFQISLATSKIF